MKCAQGTAEPWDVCGDGSFPRCPNGNRDTCPFHIRKCADRSLTFSTSENVQVQVHVQIQVHVQVQVQVHVLKHERCTETSKFREKPFLRTPYDPTTIPVSLTSEGSFLSIHPQKGGSEPWEMCRDGSFPRCSFVSRTICPFLIRKCANRFQQHQKGTSLIVFSSPGLSQEGNALWVCPTAPGSQRRGTTLGTRRRKSSIGDQIGLRIRLDQQET